MRIAVVQTLSPEPDMTASLRSGLVRLREAAEAGARLIIFPELFLGGYYLDQEMVRRASAAKAALARLQAAVDELDIAAVLGLPDPRDGVLYNSVAILRPHEDPARYAKTHLFEPEKQLFTPGGSLWTGEIAGWRCGVLVCYELGFPEIARALTLAGARLLIAPSAFGRERIRIWQVATVARAVENGVYLAAVDVAGSCAEIEFAGHSRVVDPTGTVLFDADNRAEMMFAELRPQLVDEVRARKRRDVPAYLLDRRPELYRSLCGED